MGPLYLFSKRMEGVTLCREGSSANDKLTDDSSYRFVRNKPLCIAAYKFPCALEVNICSNLLYLVLGLYMAGTEIQMYALWLSTVGTHP